MINETTRLRISNIPKHASEEDLRKHVLSICAPLTITDLRIILHENRSREFGFLGCLNTAESVRVHEKINGTYLNNRKLKVEFAIPKHDAKLPREWSKITKRKLALEADEKIKKTPILTPQINKNIDVKRLFVSNLSYETSEADLREFFSSQGEVSEATILLTPEKKHKGVGFVSYTISTNAFKALSSLDGAFLGGREIRLSVSRSGDEDKDAGPVLSETKRRILEKKLESSRNVKTFNLLYVSQHAAVESVAELLDVDSNDILAASNGGASLAARTAIAESIVIQKMKEWLKGLNISELDLNFEGNSLLSARLRKNNALSQRSMFIKHLGPWVDEYELRAIFARFGTITLFTLAPTKTIAIVSYLHASQASKAMEALLLSKYKDYPLYLEFAIAQVDRSAVENCNTDLLKTSKMAQSFDNQKASRTLYVSNLNFKSTEDSLSSVFNNCEGFRNATILKSRKTNDSLGHGFVCFDTIAQTERAMKDNLLTVLDGNTLELEFARSDTPTASDEINEELANYTTPRLIVKNLAFETSIKELREVFEAYCNVKSVRIPRKSNGRSRGFGFVELMSLDDVKKALKHLTNVHLIGRRLILLPANTDFDNVTSETLKSE